MPNAALHAESLGQAYETSVAARRADGVYYTPRQIADALVADTVGRACEDLGLEELGRLRILDPACGAGVLLAAAYDHLAARHLALLLAAPPSARRGRVEGPADAPVLSVAERVRILGCLHGVDRDAQALELARRSLAHAVGDAGATPHLRCGDALVGLDFRDPAAHGIRPIDWDDVFDVVIANPPWGQKAVVADDELKAYLRARYPSARGIFDWFRPFIEAGVRLTRPGGRFGMVLPDVVLLKDYEPTRRLLLDELALSKIAWLGQAFAAATIDVVTIAGVRQPAERGHSVEVVVNGTARRLRQRDFGDNPGCTFNLHLTDDKRAILERLTQFPRLSEVFTAHEGIHSGNIRSELFVDRAVDDSCKPLLFGRDELARFTLRWAGRYVRLAALPEKRTRERYANLGRPEWHDREKLVVRRTGDSLTAAVDKHRRYASNNFFVVCPSGPSPLDLHGLAALLNSSFMTWYFRTVEPRQGRVFAELKIEHLARFPIPSNPDGCRALNRLGARAAAGEDVEDDIQALVLDLFALPDDPTQ